jgi:hypothetical protein
MKSLLTDIVAAVLWVALILCAFGAVVLGEI